MLQPLQLQVVSDRYPSEIAELRDFLLKAGTIPATEQSLPAIVHRLQRDRAFHRDLTSHLWVVIHLAHRNISYADLLGVLAIAAAGPQFAAQAHEHDAHALLRFVLEARSALDQDKVTPTITPSLEPALPLQAPPQPAPEEQNIPWQTRPSPIQLSPLDPEEPAPSRKPILWIAACVLLALCIGLFFFLRGGPSHPSSSTPEANPATVAIEANPAPPTTATASPAIPESSLPETRTTHTPVRSRELPPRKHLPTRSHPSTPAPTPPTAAVITRSETPPSLTPRPSPPVTAAAPATPTNSSEPDRTNISRTTQPPHLVRRPPEQRAELNPNTLNTTVHATTLGPGASSVLYSPVPAYPPAASAAHVQGEVRVQATVDRQGNVASVRVISGPPLLREAALDAAQRWRFRPNMEAGQPTTMSATTVFAFQLP